MAHPTIIDAQRMTKMADKPKRKNWIKGAVKHPGVFSAKAKAAGESTAAFAAEHAGDKGKLGKQARLAQTFSGMAHKGKKLSYPNSKH